ncbi:MAG: acetyl-CoA carboxylase biotin carboxyl carrier protein [Geothrix sp.]|nr:acetyl-CoA carboxylase biotin carboxyl carrier protein [Geothrix sp.]
MSTSRKKPVAPKKPAPAAASPAPKAAAPKATGPRPATGAPLGLEEIKTLIALVGREPFQEFEFEAGDMRFRIRKDGPAPLIQAAPVMMAAPAAPYVPAVPVAAAAAVPVAAPADEAGIHYVTSPIVGTFYRASNPTATPYASPGDFVKPGQTLCIVEAMKLMNEIECDVAGEIVKVLVENGTPVEYGERLFAVRIG